MADNEFSQFESETSFVMGLKRFSSQIDAASLTGNEKFIEFNDADCGAATGIVARSIDEASDFIKDGKQVILCIDEFTYDVLPVLPKVAGLVMIEANVTGSHAKSILSNSGKPWFYYASAVDDNAFALESGKNITIDTRTKKVYDGEFKIIPGYSEEQLQKMEYLEGILYEYVEDNKRYLEFPIIASFKANCDGAENDKGYDIGLLRTERIVIGNQDSRDAVKNIFIGTPDCRDTDLLAFQMRQELDSIANKNPNRSVRIRLMDAQSEEIYGGDKASLNAHEAIYGEERGIQLAMMRPEIYEAQLRGIFSHLAEKKDKAPHYEIMVPMVKTVDEFLFAKSLVRKTARAYNVDESSYSFGSMIETKEALDKLEPIVEISDFISIGCNDLSAAVLNYSRKDKKRLSEIAKENFNRDPSKMLHPVMDEVLRDIGARSRAVKPNIDICLCGDNFFNRLYAPMVAEQTVTNLYQEFYRFSSVSLPATEVNMKAMKLDYLFSQARDISADKEKIIKMNKQKVAFQNDR